MLHEEVDGKSTPQSIADDYLHLSPLSRFIVWLLVFVLTQRSRYASHKIKLVRRGIAKHLKQ